MSLHRIVMVTTSYPRFAGDTVGTFMEPIATGLAARGHQVHVVLPWHPLLQRKSEEHGVSFHPFYYSPLPSWHVFGYAAALEADVTLRPSALAVAPAAMAAGWHRTRQIARRIGATIVHGHWVVPGGAIAACACPRRPLVVSLHGSDVYVAERHAIVRIVARRVLRRADAVIACSDDLRTRAVRLGADSARTDTVPYGVDTERFAPDPDARRRIRSAHRFAEDDEVVFAIGRFVSKKGFEHLIDAVASLAGRRSRLRLVLAGWGDLEAAYRERIARLGIDSRVLLPGLVPHDQVAGWLAAADVVAVPSARDDAGNVDGLPNVVLEALSAATPVVATTAGGLSAAVQDGRTGFLVPERDPDALAAAIERVLASPTLAREIGERARIAMERTSGWQCVAERLEAVYDRVAGAQQRR